MRNATDSAAAQATGVLPLPRPWKHSVLRGIPAAAPSLAELYATMRAIREFESLLLDRFADGALHGTTHTAIGQEHIAAAVISALDGERDVIFSNHRCHGHFLAYANDPDALFRELTGREGAIHAGIGGSQHIRYRNFYTNGIQGGITANALGAAVAEQRAGSNAIACVFVGDGTLGEGVVYESLNLAALLRAPLLIVVENNGYAQSTPTATTTAGTIEGRFAAFGIPVERTGETDPLALHRTASPIVGAVRAGGGPHTLIVDTYRLGPHSKSDDTRDPAEIARYRERDPLALTRQALDPREAERIDAAACDRIRNAFSSALAAPASAPEAFA